jgi:hypothetical protein
MHFQYIIQRDDADNIFVVVDDGYASHTVHAQSFPRPSR